MAILEQQLKFGVSPAKLAKAYFDWELLEASLAPAFRLVYTGPEIEVKQGMVLTFGFFIGSRSFPIELRGLRLEPDQGVTLQMVNGPFRRYYHEIEFVPQKAGSLLKESIDYELKGGILGALFADLYFHRAIKSSLKKRAEFLKSHMKLRSKRKRSQHTVV